MAKTVVAIFESYEVAEKTAYEIRENGLRTNNISIITKSGNGKNEYSQSYATGQMSMVKSFSTFNHKRRSRISDGIITGGIFGGVLGILIGAGSMFIPGFGLVAAAGPITGLFTGLAAGGLVGGLVDIGVSGSKGREFDRLVSNGKVLFSTKTDEDRVEDIINILNQSGALSVKTY